LAKPIGSPPLSPPGQTAGAKTCPRGRPDRHLVAHLNGVQVVGGSNPLAPTNRIIDLMVSLEWTDHVWSLSPTLYPRFVYRDTWFAMQRHSDGPWHHGIDRYAFLTQVGG